VSFRFPDREHQRGWLSPNDLAREISDRLQRRSEGAERAFAAVEIISTDLLQFWATSKSRSVSVSAGSCGARRDQRRGGYIDLSSGLLRLGRDVAAQAAKSIPNQSTEPADRGAKLD